jgi:hypothetical protein
MPFKQSCEKIMLCTKSKHAQISGKNLWNQPRTKWHPVTRFWLIDDALSSRKTRRRRRFLVNEFLHLQLLRRRPSVHCSSVMLVRRALLSLICNVWSGNCWLLQNYCQIRKSQTKPKLLLDAWFTKATVNRNDSLLLCGGYRKKQSQYERINLQYRNGQGLYFSESTNKPSVR